LTSLLVSKFIPGLSAVAAPLAGSSGAHFARFLLFDCVGALMWIASYLSVGYLFSDQLEDVVAYAMRMGSSIVTVVIGILAAWIAWKYFQRWKFLRSVNVARISADKLHAILSSGSDVTVVDVRSRIAGDDELIPGALRIPTEDL